VLNTRRISIRARFMPACRPAATRADRSPSIHATLINGVPCSAIVTAGACLALRLTPAFVTDVVTSVGVPRRSCRRRAAVIDLIVAALVAINAL
jgi:hypothetical protein